MLIGHTTRNIYILTVSLTASKYSEFFTPSLSNIHGYICLCKYLGSSQHVYRFMFPSPWTYTWPLHMGLASWKS